MSSHTELKKAVLGAVKPSAAKAPQAANPSLELAANLQLRGGAHMQLKTLGQHP